MDDLYTKYGQAVIQMKIWQERAAHLEKQIADKLNQPGVPAVEGEVQEKAKPGEDSQTQK